MPFDPTTAQPFNSGGFDPTSAQPVDARLASGATGFGMVGQVLDDLNPWGQHAPHQANALEQGIMNVGQPAKAIWDSAIANNPLLEPTRAVMEATGMGRQPGETQAQQHQRYNQAIIQARQNAAQEQQAISQRGGLPGRVAQTGLNFVAGAATNPEYFLIPGMSVGSTAAARIASAAAANAGIGTASDAAAQLMDQAEGVQKNFDVQRSLESAVTAGVFGAGVHSAIEVAPFIKGLFSQRGVDTTPPDNPLAATQITPQTQDHLALNAADHAQYQQLLQTGGVDDIKNFFQGRNGPQPSWTSVARYVAQRDAGQQNISPVTQQGVRQPFNYQQQYNDYAEQQWREQNRQAVEDHVTQQMSGWQNAPNVEVVHGPHDIADSDIRAQAISEDKAGNALGFLGSDGKVRMYSGRLTDPDTTNAVLFHEGLGHFGLAEKFGDRLDQVINSLLSRNVSQFSREVDAWQKQNPGAYGGDRTRAGEEVLAGMSENGQLKPTWQAAIGSAVRQFGRKIGLNLGYSDGEVRQILAMAHDAVVNGTSVRGNGYSVGQNKFMFLGQNAKDFDPMFTASDNQPREEISDNQAYVKNLPRLIAPKGKMYSGKLSTILDHPELFQRYPQLADMPVHLTDLSAREASGLYDPSDRSMYIDQEDPHMLSTVLHETQHAIQHIEQYPDFLEAVQGTQRALKLSPEEYYNHPSEREAFATEDRIPMTQLERQAQPLKFMRLRNENINDARDEYEKRVMDEDHPLVRNSINAHYQLMRWMETNPTFANVYDEEGLSGLQNMINATQGAADPRILADKNYQEFVKDFQLARDSHERAYNYITQPLVSAYQSELPTGFTIKRDPDASMRSHLNIKSALGIYGPNGQYIDNIDHITEPEWNELKLDIIPPIGANDRTSDNKYVTRDQLRMAKQPGYVSDDLENLAQHIETNYTPNFVSAADTRAQALQYGISPSDIKKLGDQDPGALAARVNRMGYAANLADVKVKGILDRLDTPDWTADDHVALANAIADRVYLVSRFKGDLNEYGRALAVARMFPSYTNGTIADTMAQLREANSGLSLLADPTNPEALKFARNLKAAYQSNSNPLGVNTMIQGVTKPYWEQYLNTLHMNMMLSALSTHVKAPIDMATGISRDVIERALAVPIGAVRQALGGKGQGVDPGEVEAQLYGLIRAVTDGEVYRRVWQAAKNGESSYVAPGGKVVPTNFANMYGATSNPRVPIVSKPTDLISAQDTFFRSVAMNQNLYALGRREARAELGNDASWDDVRVRGDAIAVNPTPTMLKQAYDLTQRTLLLNDNPLNAMINRGRQYRPDMTAGQRVMSFITTNLAPFIRVESNSLINRVIQRSPLGLVDPTGYTQAQLKAGGAQADIAISKMLYGTTLLGLYWAAADKAKDYLTGSGASNVDKYKEDIAAGRVPEAVHENGGYNTGGSQLAMSINPFDMHNRTAQMVASARQAWDSATGPNGQIQAGQAFKVALGSMMYDLGSMSWISDVQPAVDAVRAHGQEGESIVSSFAGNEARTWSPNLLNQAARMTDVQRDASAPSSISGRIGNEMMSTIPGLRQNLPIKYSVYGDPLQTGASATGVHTLIPGLSGNGTTETTDPAERELDRLNVLATKAVVTPVSKGFKYNPNEGTLKAGLTPDASGYVHLTPAQFEEYQRLAGRAIVETVRQQMTTQEWQQMDDANRVWSIANPNGGVSSEMKRAAREALFYQ